MVCPNHPPELADIIGESLPMRRLYAMVERVAPSDATVLIQGESGTGKELFARAVHRLSHRREGPFVAVDCGALPENLMESELFGHVKGAFTGAFWSTKGLLEAASGGTVLLDEVGNLPPRLQAKLLRVLQEREVRPVGATASTPIDVRLVSVTNTDLFDLVQRKEFREDLYFRLAVVPLAVPPLRERGEDIPLLISHFLKRYRGANGDLSHLISTEAMDLLMGHAWPGNVRELENAVERSILLAAGGVIGPELLFPAGMRAACQARDAAWGRVTRAQAQTIVEAIEQSGGNKSRAATVLGISRGTLYNRMRRCGLH